MNNTIKHISKLGLIIFPFLISVNFSTNFASEITWLGDNEYRLILTAEELNSKYATLPFSFDLDQDDIKVRYKINLDEINLASFRVVQYDNYQNPVEQVTEKPGEQYYIPSRSIVDVSSNKIKISWRTNLNQAKTFALYFSKKGLVPQEPMVDIPIIGDGDLDIIHNAHGLFGETLSLLKKVKHAGWFENIGVADQPKFIWRGEIIKKDIPRTSEHSTSPEVIDFDGDGNLDLLLGGEDGRITCFHRAFIEDELPVLRLIRMEKRNN